MFLALATANNDDSCKLLGPVSIVIQSLMGLIAICVLLLKRQHEHPKRKWTVWVYDVAKQVLGALSIHFLNLLISILKSRDTLGIFTSIGHIYYKKDEGTDPADQCDWYFLNLLLDTTLGIPILWFWLATYENILQRMGIQNIESGNYYSQSETHESGLKRKPLFAAFLKQLVIFVTSLTSMKICLFLILVYFDKFAEWFADWVLGWSDPWPNLQVFLVMFVFPVLLNCFQYLCVDNIIKLPSTELSPQNVDNFDQESIVEQEGIFITTTSSRKSHGPIHL